MNLEEFQEEAGQGSEQQPSQPTQSTAPTAAEFQQLNARFDAIAEENRHNRELIQQFISRQQQPTRREEDPEDDEPEVDGDIADDFATNGIEALTKRGVLTKKQAKDLIEEIVDRRVGTAIEKSQKNLIKDAELAREFPELQDNTSDLFKRTKAIYEAELAEDPSAAKNPRTLNRAAKEARAELIAEGKYGRNSRGGEQDFDDRETGRQRRIDAQSNDRSSRQGGFEESGDELTPRQRMIIQRFKASGEGEISEEGYKSRAKNISMGGIPKYAGGR